MSELRRIRIKDGWLEAGKEGDLLAVHLVQGRHWAMVVFDGDEDPDLHKAEGLEVCELQWKTLHP